MTSRSTWVALFGLAVLCASQVALAQKIVVLEFEGDKRGQLRTQVVRALNDANTVELLPLKDFQRIAARLGFKGKSANSAEAVAAVSKKQPFVAAVTGTVGRTFFVQILDAQGVELWSKELPLKRGLLSAQNAKRLTKPITVAAQSQPKSESRDDEEEAPPEEEKAPPEEEKAPPEEEKPREERQLPVVTEERETEEERARRLREEQAESHTETTAPSPERDLDMDRDQRRPRKDHVGPKMVTLLLGGTTTWRAYCSRPGVQSCKEYDAKPETERPAGDTVDFSPQVPYAGFGVGLEFFPLASFDNALNGLGVTAAYSRGFSLTKVRIQTPTGDAPEKQVISTDDAWQVMGAYRFYFGIGEEEPLSGYVGLKGGLAARTFEVDPAAQVPLPGSHRRYPQFGLDVSIPLAKIIRVEASGVYFLKPDAGPDELAGYGSQVQSSGFGVEAGVAGTIWGPLGYTVKFRLQSYKDLFSGAGNKWANGGAAEETYTGLFWGATAAF